MTKERRTFTRDYKIEAVRAMDDPSRTHKQLAHDLGISTSLLYKWRSTLKSDGEQEAFPGKGKRSGEDEELARLRRENEQLRRERDFLRRAAAYFAKGSPQS